jgi:hypothetical protein
MQRSNDDTKITISKCETANITAKLLMIVAAARPQLECGIST